jgi:hypothetical protein
VSSAASAGVEDLVLAVVARHRRGVAGEGGWELVAAATGVDAEDEGQEAPAGLGQGGADRLGLAGWVAVGGITDRYLSGRDPGLRRATMAPRWTTAVDRYAFIGSGGASGAR